ncbi:MAG: pseudouridine synthase [Acidimicrobiales bacterium]|nr:pseudouridine synthase [Acidimicrobiales bacterium]MDP6299292.1 pseudouridine synthase [Acidimicrobiales bacterium]HJM28755.1 pseudouridine synthase [Acidimicrobiales bacterium]HJM96650.1 pseudouridine synthase [Acidimicrobiales bacterium]
MDSGEDKEEKLQKVLARMGIASRRTVENYIADERVQVNGEIAHIGQRVNVEEDELCFDGVPLRVKPSLIYYLLHKPIGVISTAKDPQGRDTVVDLLPLEPRVFPVGRLDKESEGLLIVTNDGDLTYRLTHPSHGVEKEYLVAVQGKVSRGNLRKLREGIELEDGITAPAKVSQIDDGLVKIIIHEGKNRQVRRMFQLIGHPVKRLVRTRIGSLVDHKLQSGQWRLLTALELLDFESSTALAGRESDGKAEK